jgi:hypothetical protein
VVLYKYFQISFGMPEDTSAQVPRYIAILQNLHLQRCLIRLAALRTKNTKIEIDTSVAIHCKQGDGSASFRIKHNMTLEIC